jgi:anti-repressor protein
MLGSGENPQILTKQRRIIMNELSKVFNYQNNQVRTVSINNEPWFVARDVCEILELSDVSMSISRLDDDEKLIQKLFVSGQNRDVITISESGLYSLVLTSNKPEAKMFKRWITHEVIPQIRKTGVYVAPTVDSSMLFQIAEALKEKEQQVLMLTPKAESFDKFINGENLQDMATCAKVLGWGRNTLFAHLRENGVLRYDNTPYQQYIDRGYFEVKEKSIEMHGQTINKPQTYCTAKGIDWLHKFLNKAI